MPASSCSAGEPDAVAFTHGKSTTSEGILASAMGRIRETAHIIEDRIRCILTPDGPSLSPLRILVVDDHPDSADSLAAVLELIGCSVCAAYNGWTALRAIETFQPDVGLLDVMMPDMCGLELGARLRTLAEGRPLVLIATTALGDEDTRRRTAVAGFDCHLTKPIDASVLLESIARLWKNRERRG